MVSAFLLVSLLLFVMGAAVGSFLNVVIYRTVRGEGWVAGRSHCEHCRTKIAWYDMVPVFSYALLRGKCRSCKNPIPILHPVVEFMSGMLFVWWYWGGSLFFQLTQTPLSTLQPLFWLMVGILLLAVFVADTLYMIIPDLAVEMLFGLTVLYRIYLLVEGELQLMDFLLALASMAVLTLAFFLLWYGTKRRGLGFGDVKFAAPMALLLGWPKILVGVLVAFVVGASVGIVLLVMRKKTLTQAVPFGPFLVVGTVFALLFGESVWQWYSAFL